MSTDFGSPGVDPAVSLVTLSSSRDTEYVLLLTMNYDVLLPVASFDRLLMVYVFSGIRVCAADFQFLLHVSVHT